MNFGYTIAGFFVGAIVGLTGVGGGSLMTPLLVLVFGIHPATAVGTDLLYAALTKSGGTVVHSLKKTVDWRITGLMAAGSLPATALTLWLVSRYAPGGLATTPHATLEPRHSSRSWRACCWGCWSRFLRWVRGRWA